MLESHGSIPDAPGVLQVYAQAYDNPIPGFETKTVGNLRLFEALPETELNMEYVNNGDFAKVGITARCVTRCMSASAARPSAGLR